MAAPSSKRARIDWQTEGAHDQQHADSNESEALEKLLKVQQDLEQVCVVIQKHTSVVPFLSRDT